MVKITYGDCPLKFTKNDVIVGYHSDILSSMIIKNRFDSAIDIFAQFGNLMFPDAVLRTTYSSLPDHERFQLQNKCFDPDISKLQRFFDVVKKQLDNKISSKNIVYTKSSLYLKSLGLETLNSVEVKDIRLMDYIREGDLIDVLRSFFDNKTSLCQVLCFRVKPSIDEKYILPARILLDDLYEQFTQHSEQQYLIFIVVHLQSEDSEVGCDTWKWNPLLDWNLFMVECLQMKNALNLTSLVNNLDEGNLVLQQVGTSLLEKILPQAMTVALKSEKDIKLANNFLHTFDKSYDTLQSHISVVIMELSKSGSPFTQDHWLIALSKDTTRLANFYSFLDFIIYYLEEKCTIKLVQILKIMNQYSLFKIDKWCVENKSDVMQGMINYIIQQHQFSLDSTEFMRIGSNLEISFSPLLFDGISNIYLSSSSQLENFKYEYFEDQVEKLFKLFKLPDITDNQEDNQGYLFYQQLLADFKVMLTVRHCGSDRLESLNVLWKTVTKNESLFCKDVYAVFEMFSQDNKSLVVDLLNVHYYLKKQSADIDDDIVKPYVYEEPSVMLNMLLQCLVPNANHFKLLKIEDVRKWKKLAGCFVALFRYKSTLISDLTKIEVLLKFCNLFLQSDDVDKDRFFGIVEALEIDNVKKSMNFLRQETLEKWQNVFQEHVVDTLNIYENSLARMQLSLIESTVFYVQLSYGLDKKFLNDTISKIVNRKLPLGFLSILYNFTKNDTELKSLFFQYIEDELEMFSSSKIDVLFLISGFLKPTDINIEELIQNLEFLRVDLKSSECITLQNLCDLMDMFTFFKDAIADSTVTHTQFQLFPPECQEKLLQELHIILRSNIYHPIWMIFLRCLRCKYSLGEIHELLKRDQMTQIIPLLERETFLTMGDETCICPYLLRFPFMPCFKPDIYQESLLSMNSIILQNDWAKYSKLDNFLFNPEGDKQYLYGFCDLLSAFIEKVLFFKSFQNLEQKQKTLSREILKYTEVFKDKGCLLSLLSSNSESFLSLANITPQSSNTSLTLSTLYFSCLIYFLAFKVQKNSIVDDLKNSEKLVEVLNVFPDVDTTPMLIKVRLCSCFTTTLFISPEQESSFNCLFCESNWNKDLESCNVKLPLEPFSPLIKLTRNLILIFFKAVLNDSIPTENRHSQTLPQSLDEVLVDSIQQMAVIMRLSLEDVTWIIHSILEESECLFQAMDHTEDVMQILDEVIAVRYLNPHKTISEFKAKKITERKLSTEFAYACAIDGVKVADLNCVDVCCPLFFPVSIFNFQNLKVVLDLKAAEQKSVCYTALRAIALFDKDLDKMHLLKSVINWHNFVVAQINETYSSNEYQTIRVDDFLKAHKSFAGTTSTDIWSQANKSWALLTSSSGVNPFVKSNFVKRTLLTEHSELAVVAKAVVIKVNDFLKTVAASAVELDVPELQFLIHEDNRNAATFFVSYLTSGFSYFPACSLSELDEFTQVYVSRDEHGDIVVSWDLLQNALIQKLIVDKHFIVIDFWEPQLIDSKERDLDSLIKSFHCLCPGMTKLTDSEKSVIAKHQKEDMSFAHRLVRLCRTAFSLVHRTGIDNPDKKLSDFIKAQFSTVSDMSDLSQTLAIVSAFPLNKLLNLLCAAEEQQFVVVLPELKRRQMLNSEQEAAVDNWIKGLKDTQKHGLLELCKSACVRHLLSEEITEGVSLNTVVTDPDLSPAGVEIVDVKMPENWDLNYLFCVTNKLNYQISQKGVPRNSRLLNRL